MASDDKSAFLTMLQDVGATLLDTQVERIGIVYEVPQSLHNFDGEKLLEVLHRDGKVLLSNVDELRGQLERNRAGEAVRILDDFLSRRQGNSSTRNRFLLFLLHLIVILPILLHFFPAFSVFFSRIGLGVNGSHSIGSEGPPVLTEFFNVDSCVQTFVDREAMADRLSEVVKPPDGIDSATQYYILIGQGGTGKTQMSLWFCEHMKGKGLYSVIWFMSGDGPERFTEDLEDLIEELKIEYQGIPPKKLKRLLSQELNRRGRWLLVVDNFEGMVLKDLNDRIPEWGGTVLLTARNSSLSLPVKNIVKMLPFSEDETSKLFEEILGKGLVNESDLKTIRDIFGNNALDLSVCAYYLREKIDAAGENVLNIINDSLENIIKESTDGKTEETIKATYERSLLKLETESSAAWRLLCKLSLISPDGVDKDIVEGFELDHTTFMGKIQRLGLAERRGDKYYVHRLMMKVVQERMKNSTSEFTSVLEEVIGDMYRMWIWDSRDHTQWKKKQEMGEHVVTLTIYEHYLSSPMSREKLVDMLRDYSFYTIEVKGDYTTAEERITKAEQVEGGGKCSKVVRAALKSVRGVLRSSQGKYNEAITEYREGLEMEEEESRKASKYNSLGICLRNLKKYPEALEEYEKSLEIDMKYKGENSIDVSYTLDNMGGCLSSMGSYEEALENHRRALKIRLDKYGEVNPLVANSYNNIGACYTKMKKYEESLEMFEKALEIKRQVYGEGVDHPDVATSLYNIGISNIYLRRRSEAKPHLEEAYRIRKRMLGEDHPDTISTKTAIKITSSTVFLTLFIVCTRIHRIVESFMSLFHFFLY